MTAKYKRRRFLTENSIDKKPIMFSFEGAERQEAKREIAEEINKYNYTIPFDRELEYEREMQMATECYNREKADPNYKCTCFVMDDEDEG